MLKEIRMNLEQADFLFSECFKFHGTVYCPETILLVKMTFSSYLMPFRASTV